MTTSTVPAATVEEAFAAFYEQVVSRLHAVAEDAARGGLDAAIDLVVASIRRGGVLQAFGTGHSQAFAMEIAGRAGGFIPTTAMALRDVVLHGSRETSALTGSTLERDASVVDELFALTPADPADVFLIASNSGVNGSVVGVALRAKADGHPVIAVTSLEHTNAVTPELPGGIGVGAVSSLTAAYIAQLITIGAAARIAALGETPPIYLSANIPGGDDHNHALEARYGDRIRRTA